MLPDDIDIEAKVSDTDFLVYYLTTLVLRFQNKATHIKVTQTHARSKAQTFIESHFLTDFENSSAEKMGKS